MFGWLKRESVAVLAMLGAALTVLAQLRHAVPMAPWLERALDYWLQAIRGFWRPPLVWLGMPVHRDLVAALTLAAFMTVIGAGGVCRPAWRERCWRRWCPCAGSTARAGRA